jgi:hypothetical protein
MRSEHCMGNVRRFHPEALKRNRCDEQDAGDDDDDHA